LFLVAHPRAFEAPCGKFWTNKLMVGQYCKINLRCVNFACALSLPLQTGATFSSPNYKITWCCEKGIEKMKIV
jgi:hypothetical protein